MPSPPTAPTRCAPRRASPASGDSPCLPGARLAGAVARHPLAGEHYRFDVPLLPAGFVDTEQGTGFVHIAPGHGADDFALGRAHGLETPSTVDNAGCYRDDVPMFAGAHVYKVGPAIAGALEAAGRLLARERHRHSYPHSWRSKKPVIFRATPQWFIRHGIDGPAADGAGRHRRHALLSPRRGRPGCAR